MTLHPAQIRDLQDMGDDFVEGTDEGSGWSSDQVSRFFDAFQEHGQDWAQVSRDNRSALVSTAVSLKSDPAGLTAGWQDCPAKRGFVQAALLILEPGQPADTEGGFYGHGQGLSRA